MLGCFVSGPSVMSDDSKAAKELAAEQGVMFRSYIWGKSGISTVLKRLQPFDYGNDLLIILFKFYLNPIPYELKSLKEIGGYSRKKNQSTVQLSSQQKISLVSKMRRGGYSCGTLFLRNFSCLII